jgi:molecular chaperone GrpE
MRNIEDTELGGADEAAEQPLEAGGDIDESGRTLEQLSEEAAAASPDDALARVSAQRDEYLALAQRTQADFENYRKRVAREAANAELRGVGRLARELLPALDNLERALAAAGELDPQVLEGLRLVHRELAGALERVGIETFGAAGERFDPELHEAVAQQPAADGVEPGAISEVYQAGYRLAGGAILRPARVVVAG